MVYPACAGIDLVIETVEEGKKKFTQRSDFLCARRRLVPVLPHMRGSTYRVPRTSPLSVYPAWGSTEKDGKLTAMPVYPACEGSTSKLWRPLLVYPHAWGSTWVLVSGRKVYPACLDRPVRHLTILRLPRMREDRPRPSNCEDELPRMRGIDPWQESPGLVPLPTSRDRPRVKATAVRVYPCFRDRP